ncbi:MAG: uracil phosphoribosyltransferase [Bacteroidales bacterium]|nr:MAG: uracil phosphoribosyltransferase [Bacteroidales bacterium]
MKVVDLSQQNSVLNNFIRDIRDVEIQKDSLRFRRNIERIGEVIAIELSKALEYRQTITQTPLDKAKVNIVAEQIVVSSILRAGLPLHNGILSIFDDAQNAFVSAYRKYRNANDFDIHVEYISSPDLNDKTLIIADPMLATGGSMEMSYKALLSKGTPANIHLASVISSQYAIDYLQTVMPEHITLWTATIDEKIDEHAYIVPGLGDAGDLAYGEKLD